MPSNTESSCASSANGCNRVKANYIDTINTISADTRGELSYILDKADGSVEGSIDCRNCITTGNKVHLLVKANRANNPDRYVWVSEDHIVMIRSTIADADSIQVLFNWINSINGPGFSFLLQNKLVLPGQYVGVERFADGASLSLQVKQSDSKQNYLIYMKQNSSEYFALYLRSSEGHIYYILPVKEALKIYRSDRITVNDNVFVFRTSLYQCSNRGGSCPFERLMRTYA